MKTLVMKFGGSCVGATTALTQVLSIVLQASERRERLLLVASALDGVTDALLEATHLAYMDNQRGYRRIFANLRARHLALIEGLPLGAEERKTLEAETDKLLFDMLDISQNLAHQVDEMHSHSEALDAIVGFGERLSARIIAALLRQNGLRGVAIDATDLIVTDSAYGQATPNLAQTRARIAEALLPMMERDIIPVVTGFIGATTSGRPTTLGRGGSDYTASILGACIDANEVWIWADVDGMMTTDPRLIASARTIPTLSYGEVAELAYFGAQILHNKMVGPLRRQGIPLWIKNVYRPQHPGTLVHNKQSDENQRLKAVTAIQGLGLAARHSGPIFPVAALVDAVLHRVTNSHTDVMFSSQSSEESFLCFVIPTSVGPDAIHSVAGSVRDGLAADPTLAGWEVEPVSVITVIGNRLDEMDSLTARIFQALSGIRLLAISYGPSHSNLSLTVAQADAEATLYRLHELVLSNG